MIRKYETINSFTRRPVVTQIAAYLVFLGETLTFFICMYINFRNTTRQITILVLYIVTAIIQVIVSLMTSYIDPSDNIMIEYRNNSQNRRNMKVQDCLYCDICTSYVKETSRHCKVCQRCVQQFDHHCMWINNCVGSKNYNHFLAMIISTYVNMVVYVVGMFLLWTEGGWTQYLGQMVSVWIFSVIVFIFSILLLNLIILHIYLICKGLTTYQFIMLQREQQKRKKLQQQTAKQQKELQEEQKNKQTSIEHQIKTILTKRKMEQSQKTQKQQSSNQKTQSIQTKQLNPINTNDLRSQSSSNVIFQTDKNNLNIENQLRTQKSQQQSNYSTQKKKIIQNVSILQNSQQQNQLNDEIQYNPMTTRNQRQPNISNFFTKNKSLKFFIGQQIGSRPKSTINRRQKLQQQNYFRTTNNKDKDNTKTNKSMYAKGSKKDKQQVSAISLKIINIKQNQTTPSKLIS